MSERDRDRGREWGRVVSPAVVTASGLGLVAVELRHATRMESALGVSLEAVLPLALALALASAGVWLARSPFDGDGRLRVAGWSLVGGASMLLVTAWIIAHQLIRGGSFHHAAFVLTNGSVVGGIGGFVVGVYDARSERRRAALADERRKLARERERMAFLNRLLRHNVLNEMNVVLGKSDSLYGRVDDGSRDDLRAITRCSEDVVGLIQKVNTLTYAATDGEPSLEPVSLSEALAGEVERLRLARSRAKVVADVPPDLAVRADGLLSEVFENVLSNAVDHHDGDRPRVTVRARRRGARAVVTVADDGPGIPDGRKRRLFRAAEPDVPASGHGVGLVIARVLVDRYGGEIRVEDNEPTGTVVRIELPIASSATRPPERAIPPTT